MIENTETLDSSSAYSGTVLREEKNQTGLLMRLSIACLFWATIIGFLIQIFLTLGKTGVVSECTPPLLALWLSFLLIT